MRRLYRISALVSMLALLGGCVQDPIALYRNARHGNYRAVISALDQAPSAGPRLTYGARGYAAAPHETPSAIEPLRGRWNGSMDCGGQTRSVDLYVFSPRPRQRSLAVVGPMTERGRLIYEVRGSEGYSGQIQMNPSKQIGFTPGFRPVGFSGALQQDGTFVGTALGGGCGDLRLTRTVGPDEPRFVNAERDNGAFRRELLSNDFLAAQALIPTDSATGRALQIVGLCGLIKCPGINLPGIVGMAPGATSGGSSAPRFAPADSGERWERAGPNDWSTVPTIDPPQIVSPQIKAPAISPHYE